MELFDGESIEVDRKNGRLRITRAKEPNAAWDAVCEAFGLNPVTTPERSRVGKLARELTAKLNPLHELTRRIEAYKAAWPGIKVTPEGVMKHWDELKPKTSQTDVTRATIERQRQADAQAKAAALPFSEAVRRGLIASPRKE